MPYIDMSKKRLTSLADGLFAIIMTVLVLKLSVPVTDTMSNMSLWLSIREMYLEFLVYIMSFGLLFVYWRSHNYIISEYARNVNQTLIMLNGLFFLAVSFIPFTTAIIGAFSNLEIAISMYAIHIILIGILLYWMKKYVIHSGDIKSQLSERDIRNGNIRILLPIILALFAIPFSFINTTVSFVLFAIMIMFNLVPYSTNIVIRIVNYIEPVK